MKNYKCYFLLPIIWLSFFGMACNKHTLKVTGTGSAKKENTVPSYNVLDNWAAHPYKKDPSDSVPKDLQSSFTPDSTVDVFFIHPTTLTSQKENIWNADISNDLLNKKTDKTSILYQASVFNESCRVFAPRYRQAHIKAFFIEPEKAAPYFDLAYSDISTSFAHYLQQFNNGRPIIIAAHSQGTLHAARLLKEFFENKPLMNKLVCAYIVGLPVPEDYFTVLQPCKNATQTGCFVSWRSFRWGYEGPEYVLNETKKSVVINPLSWTMDTLKVVAKMNKGGVLKNFNKIVPGVVSARVYKNILWTSKPKFFGNIFLTTKNYHVADYNFFYMNIRENVRQRIGAFWKN